MKLIITIISSIAVIIGLIVVVYSRGYLKGMAFVLETNKEKLRSDLINELVKEVEETRERANNEHI